MNLLPPRVAGRTRALGLLAVLGAPFGLACGHPATIRLAVSSSTPTTIHHPALYPETIVYNKASERFLVGSFREGAVFEVDSHGAARRLVEDERLNSVLGIAVDERRARLWAVNADLGASARASAAGPKNVAAVGIYDLTTGAALQYIDLASLGAGPHLLNGIALAADGTAYVTDSFAPVIYKVDAQGGARVFVRDARFEGAGINLNGVVVHPDGYLLVIKKSDGRLFKVPLHQPEALSEVAIKERFIGGDGLLLIGKESLVVVSNQVPGAAANSAYAVVSQDAWGSATLRATQSLGDVYPTTAVQRGDQIFVVHSKLNELIAAPAEQKAELRSEASITRIGSVQ